MKKKILIIDFWIKAIPSHIMPFYNYLNKDKFEVILLSFASIVGNDEGKNGIVERIPFYDYTNFSRFDIKKVFKQIAPDLIIIFNHCDLIDRAVLKIGKKLEIPVFFIQHGFFLTHIGRESYKEFIGNKYNLRRYCVKFKKYIYFFINYLLASQFVDKLYIFKKEFYIIIFNALTDPIKFLNCPPKSELTSPDLSFVYGEKDKELLINTYDYPESSIIVSGSVLFERYLDIPQKEYSQKEKNEWLLNRGLNIEKDTVLFLPTINTEWGVPGWDRDAFRQMVNTVYQTVNKKGFNFIVKLHPSADEGLYRNLKDVEGIWMTRDVDLLDLIWESDLIIAETSTAVIPCVLFKKPIIHLQLIPNARLGFDYSKYDVGVVCRTEQDLNKLLENRNRFNELVDSRAYVAFEKKFCNYGKMKTSRLIANYIEKYING